MLIRDHQVAAGIKIHGSSSIGAVIDSISKSRQVLQSFTSRIAKTATKVPRNRSSLKDDETPRVIASPASRCVYDRNALDRARCDRLFDSCREMSETTMRDGRKTAASTTRSRFGCSLDLELPNRENYEHRLIRSVSSRQSHQGFPFI
jgi:hypothetical protein